MTLLTAPVRTVRPPLWTKIGVSLFAAVLVPVYWRDYGPADFLWFCDAGLLLTVIALWTESRLLISMNALALAVPQTIWAIDFFTGGRILGISAYMFDPHLPLFTRFLSTFHLWLPVLLVWLVWRMGYDRRALIWQTALMGALLILSYLFTDPRHPPSRYPNAAVNVNRVYGPKVADVQTAIPSLAYVALELLLFAGCIYLPSHVVFNRIVPRRGDVPARSSEPAAQTPEHYFDEGG